MARMLSEVHGYDFIVMYCSIIEKNLLKAMNRTFLLSKSSFTHHKGIAINIQLVPIKAVHSFVLVCDLWEHVTVSIWNEKLITHCFVSSWWDKVLHTFGKAVFTGSTKHESKAFNRSCSFTKPYVIVYF